VISKSSTVPAKDGGYIADIPDLAACSAFGATPEEAGAGVKEAKGAWLTAAREEGRDPSPSLPAGDLLSLNPGCRCPGPAPCVNKRDPLRYTTVEVAGLEPASSSDLLGLLRA
jgi:predicted RNase H-like HicB family nuclease